jgi:mono/diheme cytochrome c family protein
MRPRLAALLAVATGLAIVVLSALFAWVQNRPPAPRPEAPVAAEAPAAPGRRVYDEQRCQACHSIAGVGNVRHPLDGVGSRLTRDEVTRWIVAPQTMQPDVAKRAYDLPPAQLEALVDYLMSLKSSDRRIP